MAGQAGIVLGHPRAVVIAVAAVVLAFAGAAAAHLDVDNTVDAWLPAADPDLARYREFRGHFGEDSFVVAALAGADLRVEPERGELAALAAELAVVPGVERVLAPGEPGASPLLLAADGRAAALVVLPDAGLEHGERGRIVARVAAVLDRPGLVGRVHLAGPETINQALDAGSRESFGRLFPLVLGLMGLVLVVLLRDARPVTAIVLVAGSAAAVTLGALALAGRSLNMVVASVPALLTVLATAYSLHLVNAFEAGARTPAPGGSARDAAAERVARWSAALAQVRRPATFTALTTAAGLGALALADIPPVRDLGLLAALGTLVTYGLAFTLLPAFLLVTGWGGRARAERGAAWGPRLAALVARARGLVLGTTAVLVVVAGAGVARLRVQSDILSFFPPDHPLVTSTAWIEERLFGLTPIEVRFSGPLATFLAPATRAAAAELARTLAAEPDVTAVLGPLADGASGDAALLGTGAAALAGAPAGAAGAPPELAHRLRIAAGRVDARWTVAARTTPIEESAALVDRVEAALAAGTPAGVEAEVTGAIPLLVRLQALLLSTQIRTFGASLALVTGLLWVAFRSLRLALVSLVPNVLPVLATLGAMGFLGIPLDVATVTVAGIALGLVVDDTIHLLDRWRRAATLSGTERAADMLRHCGRPVLATSVVVAAGFSAFALAPFRPTFLFGALVAGTAVSALACDLVLLPALLGAAPRAALGTAVAPGASVEPCP